MAVADHEREPWGMGYDAGRGGHGPSACPYKPSSDEGIAWQNGHTHGRRDYLYQTGEASARSAEATRIVAADFEAAGQVDEPVEVVEVARIAAERQAAEHKARRRAERAAELERMRAENAAADDPADFVWLPVSLDDGWQTVTVDFGMGRPISFPVPLDVEPFGDEMMRLIEEALIAREVRRAKPVVRNRLAEMLRERGHADAAEAIERAHAAKARDGKLRAERAQRKGRGR